MRQQETSGPGGVIPGAFDHHQVDTLTSSKIGRQTYMISTGLIISFVVCVALTLLAYKMSSLPIIFISSIGLVICGLQTFQQTEEILPMLMLFIGAVGQFMLIKKEAA